MERRGRKRKNNRSIPSHIDQGAIPSGCYWQRTSDESGFWYTFTQEGDKKKKTRLAGRDAKLSDLHKIMESLKSGDDTMSFKWLAKKHFETPEFKKASKKTKGSYNYAFDSVCQFKTKIKGVFLADTSFNEWDTAMLQRVFDSLWETPTKAKHMHTFMRLVFNSGKRRGYCKENPCIGVKLPEERKKRTLPTQAAYDKLLSRAKERGTFGQKTKGSCPHYIWPIMEILYLCYLRGVEARNMTDAHIRDGLVKAERRKNSGANLIRMKPRLQEAIDHLRECRRKILSSKKLTIPIKPEERFLIVSTLGSKVTYSAYQNSWNRFIRLAIAEGVIDESERFSLHDLKRKGVTDSDEENPAEHKDPRMGEIYDHSVRIVDPASD